MWSKPLSCHFQQPGEIQQTQVLQGFAAFCHNLTRIPPRHSQSKRATNCANPGFLVIEFCARCGQTCGQAVFLTTSTCGGSACIAGVSRDCGHSVFWLEGGATRSQSKRATNCANPEFFIIITDLKIYVQPQCNCYGFENELYFDCLLRRRMVQYRSCQTTRGSKAVSFHARDRIF